MSSAHPLTSLVNRAAPITGEELYHLPDLGPCELVEGRICPMTPTNWRHGELVTKLASRLFWIPEHTLPVFCSSH